MIPMSTEPGVTEGKLEQFRGLFIERIFPDFILILKRI